MAERIDQLFNGGYERVIRCFNSIAIGRMQQCRRCCSGPWSQYSRAAGELGDDVPIELVVQRF